MTASFVAAGTPAASNYVTSLAVPLPAGTATGDLLVIYAACRKTSAVVGPPPAGWLEIFEDTHTAVYAKYKTASEPTPNVTFSGGVSGDSVQAHMMALRGAAISTSLDPQGIVNASAQNIALPPPATPDRAGSVLLYFGWKQSNWTGVATIGDAEIGDPSTALGSTQGIVWDYDIQGAPAASVAGPYVVTGGVAAASKAYLVAFNNAASVSVITQDVYPPRNLVTVADIQVGDVVSVYRVVDGNRTLLRAGSTASATATAFLVVDAELPFGVPVSYVAVVNSDEWATAPVTYDLPGGKVALSDAISGLSAELVVWAWPDKLYTRAATVFQPGGRHVVVVSGFGQFESDVELYTDSISSMENLRTLLANATGGIVQVRQPGGYDDVDGYVAVTSYKLSRHAQDGSDPKRRHVLHAVEVDGWAPGLAATGFTYAQAKAAYAGLTYANWKADYATYLLALQGDYS